MGSSDHARIVGVGETQYTRGTDESELSLLIQASLAACRDAGISSTSVDGLILAGFHGRAEDLIEGLRIRDLVWSSRVEMGGASAVAAVGQAAHIVESGAAERVLVSTGRLGYSGNRIGAGGDSLLETLLEVFPSPLFRTEFEHPYGLMVPLQYYALLASRWYADFDIDEKALATVAVEARRHASLNSKAYMRDRPMSPEAYFASPLIASNIRLLDCCIETDGAAAVVISTRSSDTGQATNPVRIMGSGEGRPGTPDDIVSRADWHELGITRASRRAYESAGIDPSDVDFAELYDCFTFVVMRQLEEAGFCARGDSSRFVLEDGIHLNGRLPVNTHGGLLSQAHVIGMNHVVEAVRQLRGAAGAAQLSNPRIGAVTGYGDFGDGAMLVLGRTQ